MKPYLFIIAFFVAAFAGQAQQLPSQVQAKRGVFTDRIFLNDRWINRIATSVPSIYDSNDNGLPTTKAMADFLRLHSIQTSSVTADRDYVHNWNHKQLRIDSINHLQFDAFETDSLLPDNEKVHNTIRMFPGAEYDSAISLISVLRNINNNADSITSKLNVSPIGATLSYQDDKRLLSEGPSGGALSFGAYNNAGGNYSEMFIAPEALELSNLHGNFYIHGLSAANTTGTYKPIVYDASSDKIAWLNTWPGSTTLSMDTAYVPVFTGLNNIDSVSGGTLSVIRVGSTVHVEGYVTIDPTNASGTYTSVEMSLPWATNISKKYSCTGIGFNFDYGMGAQITGDPSTNKALFKFVSTTTNAADFIFSFQYTIAPAR